MDVPAVWFRRFVVNASLAASTTAIFCVKSLRLEFSDLPAGNRVCSSWNFSARGRVAAYGKIDIQMRASTQAQVDGGGREFQISKIPKKLIETPFQNIAVQIVQGGAVKDELSLARAPVRWSAALSTISGFVLNKNEIPFAPLYSDRYVQIKTR
jgi:hypothetical protein